MIGVTSGSVVEEAGRKPRIELDDHRRRFIFVLYSNLVMLGPIALLASLGDSGTGWAFALSVLMIIWVCVSVFRMTRRGWTVVPIAILQAMLAMFTAVFLPAAYLRVAGDRQTVIVEDSVCTSQLSFCDNGYLVRTVKDSRQLGPVEFKKNQLPASPKGARTDVYALGTTSIVPLPADDVSDLVGGAILTVFAGLLLLGALEGAVRVARRWPGPQPAGTAGAGSRGGSGTGGRGRSGKGSAGGKRGGQPIDPNSPTARARQAAMRGRSHTKSSYQPGASKRSRGGK